MTANVPIDLLDRLRAVEDKLRQIEGRTQQRPAQNQVTGGGVTISKGGTLSVVTPNGQTVLYIGAIGPNHPDGTAQFGTVFRREDGSAAMAIWDGAGASPQPLAIWDRAGNTIIADDRMAGQGLARPYLSTDAWFGATEVPAYTTSSTSWTTLQHLIWYKQHPRVEANFLARCSDATTSGQIQLIDDANNVVAGPADIAAGAFLWGSVTGAVSGGHETRFSLHWQARVTPGSTGSIGVRGLSTFGIQS
ncbi:hypothetical protein ACFYS8_13480 [Kitasatospora sp. NPDC004615]|uniref:hypothetical protein n=1 Tax=Kitasatospora sp. NPDC004615 TaxID=3364017 RepID=UPI00367A5483